LHLIYIKNMSRDLNNTDKESLARAVARGRSLASWARKHDAELDAVRAVSLLPEFRTLVQTHRLHVADRMVGKLMTLSTRSIDQMFAASIRSPSYHVKLSACRMLLDKWLVISRRFDDWKQLDDVKAQLTELEQELKKGVGRIQH
jgi:hypothetical protein